MKKVRINYKKIAIIGLVFCLCCFILLIILTNIQGKDLPSTAKMMVNLILILGLILSPVTMFILGRYDVTFNFENRTISYTSYFEKTKVFAFSEIKMIKISKTKKGKTYAFLFANAKPLLFEAVDSKKGHINKIEVICQQLFAQEGVEEVFHDQSE